VDSFKITPRVSWNRVTYFLRSFYLPRIWRCFPVRFGSFYFICALARSRVKPLSGVAVFFRWCVGWAALQQPVSHLDGVAAVMAASALAVMPGCLCHD
jgi:hypothetical protein